MENKTTASSIKPEGQTNPEAKPQTMSSPNSAQDTHLSFSVRQRFVDTILAQAATNDDSRPIAAAYKHGKLEKLREDLINKPELRKKLSSELIAQIIADNVAIRDALMVRVFSISAKELFAPGLELDDSALKRQLATIGELERRIMRSIEFQERLSLPDRNLKIALAMQNNVNIDTSNKKPEINVFPLHKGDQHD